MNQIHPTAVIHDSARLAEDVQVGPFVVIGAEVEIGSGSLIGAHAVIEGPTSIGRDNHIHPFASVGVDPQDRKYGGERTRLSMGDRNVIREYATISRGTVQGLGYTRLGDDNTIMAYAHVAHDCELGNDIIMANGASLAGHVWIGDHAILGGFTMVHQFCRIGAYSFCGMGSAINQDIPPFVLVAEHPARPRGINTEGLRRHGFDAACIGDLRQAYRLLYRAGLKLEQAIEKLRALARKSPQVGLMADFIENSRRGIRR